MKKVGTVIDDWKLPFFEKTLKKKGYKYKVIKGLFPGTLFLKIETETTEELFPIIEKINQKALNSKLH